MKALLGAALFLAAPGSADVWNCQLPGHAGIWQTDGNELVLPSPAGPRRLTIASDSVDSIVAVNGVGRHVEMAVINRRRL